MTFPFNVPVTSGKQSVTYRDAKGNTSTMHFYFNGTGAAHLEDIQSDVLDVLAALDALTNAALQSTNGLVGEWGVAQYGSHTSGGAYESVIEKAVMVLQDAAGQLHRIQVPAPKIAIFLADKITVDPANGLVAAFIAAFTTAQANGTRVVTRQEIDFTNYMGGYFQGRKLRRRVSVLTLTPQLTGSIPAE